MSDSITKAVPRYQVAEPARPQTGVAARWIKRVALLVVLLWIATEIISLAVQHTRLRRVLTSRMEAAFGRPVEVRSYGFSLWNGPALEANSVTVGEDPRFGQEYFLRAESMTVRLRWTSLLRGHLVLGTLSLTQPSLNLVRNPSGDWNLVDWLPRPAESPSSKVLVGPSLPFSPLRFDRIDVDGGRINFKNGDEKLPFAFVGVKGTVETDRPGRWLLNLDANPWRAAVAVQQAGTIHVSGDLGGTSSRLRPAALDISWTEASVSDVLRLVGGNDLGLRGALALAVNARTDEIGDGWTVKTRAQFQQVHRWDLAPRADNPSLDLSALLAWSPSAPYLEITNASLNAPHSQVNANGRLYWGRDTRVASRVIPPVQVVYTDAVIDLNDFLAWANAFRPGISPSLDVRGFARTHAAFSGWPPRLVNAAVSSGAVDLSGLDLRRPAHLSELSLRYDGAVVTFLPVTLNFGSPDDALRFESSAKSSQSASRILHLSANISDVHDVLAIAGALGWNLARGWDVSGPLRADLRWQGARYPWQSPPVGFINFGAGPGADVLRVPFLNLPVSQINAIAEWKPGARHISLASAEAFGARWSGTFDSRDPAGDWQFALAADHLAAADLDRWLNPAWRQSFLGRMLPFFNSRLPVSVAPENLRASGRLTLEQFALAPFVVHRLQGNLDIDGRRMEFTGATGQFYGGQIGGSLRADMQAQPSYHLDLDFSGVETPALIAATPLLAGLRADSASGQISFDAGGASRADLIASLTCQGSVRATSPELLNADFSNVFGARSTPAGTARFVAGSAAFTCAHGKIDFETLTLNTSAGSSANGSGTIDFSRNLDLRFRIRPASPLNADSSGDAFSLTGPLAAPNVVPAHPPVRRSR